jgi:hypothetical protein
VRDAGKMPGHRCFAQQNPYIRDLLNQTLADSAVPASFLRRRDRACKKKTAKMKTTKTPT